jgi:hypothetical protein
MDWATIAVDVRRPTANDALERQQHIVPEKFLWLANEIDQADHHTIHGIEPVRDESTTTAAGITHAGSA